MKIAVLAIASMWLALSSVAAFSDTKYVFRHPSSKNVGLINGQSNTGGGNTDPEIPTPDPEEGLPAFKPSLIQLGGLKFTYSDTNGDGVGSSGDTISFSVNLLNKNDRVLKSAVVTANATATPKITLNCGRTPLAGQSSEECTGSFQVTEEALAARNPYYVFNIDVEQASSNEDTYGEGYFFYGHAGSIIAQLTR